MLIGDRIKLIMKANRLNAAQFADTIGVKPANLSHILSGRNKPSMDFLEKVIQTFDNVNASWLLTGEIKENREVQLDSKSSQNTQADIPTKHEDANEIDRIVIFFKNGSFRSYSTLDNATGE